MSDTTVRTRRPLVWVVDDSPTEAAITERSLGTDYVFEKFSDGSTVVETLSVATQLPDLLLLDWVMPGMTGDEVCRFLRSRAETRDLPIIIVTASRVDTQDIVAGLAHGANDYVPRPFAPEELRARVDAALRTKQLADLAKRERQRLTTVNRLGHGLFQSIASAEQIVDELARALTETMCDGCSVLILPGPLPTMAVARHRHEPGAARLALIASVADPVVHAFTSTEDARATLPPAYADYIDRYGLRGLAILPFPIRDPIRGVVTVTREGSAQPFDTDDIATIETCIEYTSLAIERAMRFDAERVARQQLNTVLESLPVGILATDERGELALVNSAARQLVPDIGSASTLADVFRLASWSAADGTAIVDPETLLGGAQIQLPVNVDLRLRIAGDDAVRTVALSAVPLRDGTNSIVGSVTVLEDVTADRAITAERERTAKFQEEMLGIVGHDLRNPLNAVFGGAELLEFEIEPDSSMGKTLRRIKSSATRMTRIIEQLLDVTHARLGAGIPVTLQEVSLLPIVNDVIDELRLAHPRADLVLSGTTDIRGIWDPDRLEQVISNLVSNAVQYGAREQPVHIDVTQTATTAAITVRNSIRDAPIGPDMLGALFEPYRRGKTSVHVAGLGLGLYIVNAIVRSHRGTIDVQSTNAGTVFRVVLPLAPAR